MEIYGEADVKKHNGKTRWCMH